MDEYYKKNIYIISALLSFVSFYVQGVLHYLVKVSFPTSSIFLVMAIPNLFIVLGILCNHSFKNLFNRSYYFLLLSAFYFLSLYSLVYVDLQKNIFLSQTSSLSYSEIYLKYLDFSNVFMYIFLIPLGAYYLLYGVFISSLWKEFEADKIRKIYSLDLLFSALGIIISCFVISLVSIKVFLIIPLIFLIFVNLLSSRYRWRGLTNIFSNLIILSCVLVISFSDWTFHPNLKLSSIAVEEGGVKLVDQQFSREAMLSLFQNKNNHSYNIQLDNGIGTVGIPAFPARDKATKGPQIFSSFGANVKNVLVLMAGAGSDAQLIKQLIPEVAVDNIEINERYKELIYKNMPEIGSLIYEDPTSRFYFMDARIFLEKNKKKYDSIVFSFHGSPIANFLGTSSSYNDYLYTAESFRKAISSLTPEGSLLVFSGNKFQILTTLYSIDGQNLKNNVVILRCNPHENNTYWRNKNDGVTLIFKRASFSKVDMDRISQLADYAGYNIIYSPLQNYITSNTYSKLLHSYDFMATLKSYKKSLRDLEPVLDDSPFSFRLEDEKLISNLDYWKEAIAGLIGPGSAGIIKKSSLQIILILLIPISFVFYLFLHNKKSETLTRSFSFLLACLFIGFGHTLLQTTITTSYRLFFGGTTMPLLLCSSYILIGLSIGAFFLEGMLKFFKSILLITTILYVSIFAIQAYPHIFWENYSLMAPCFIMLIIFFFAFVGTIFPYIFTRMKLENTNVSSFALVWDILASLVIFCFFNDLLVVFGNKFLFLAAMAFYAIALFLVLAIRFPKELEI